MKIHIHRRAFLAATAKASVGLIAASLGLSACSRRRANSLKLAFVPKALNNPVFEITRAGAEDRVRQLHGVSFRWLGSTTTDAVAQSQIIDDLIVQGIDGICLSCNDPAALMPAINRAVDAGAAVVTWDSDAPRSKRLTNVGIDQEAAGYKAGELMLGRLKAGKVAILTGTPGALNLEKRRGGFLRAIAKNPELHVVATDPCNDDVQRAVEIVEQRINATPDLAGYFFVGMWPFFTDLKTLPQLKSFVAQRGVCISLDALQGALDAVEQGYASALVGYSWYGFGQTAVDVLVNYIRQGVKPPDPLNAELFIVDPANVASYQRRQHETGGRF
jgi:ribose transport system substrate-binding protein